MSTPLAGFVTSLHAFDPLLSVRYGDVSRSWIIERKAFIPQDELAFLRRRRDRTARIMKTESPLRPVTVKTFVGVSEELASAQDGKRVVLFAETLDSRVFDSLCLGDIQRYGGYSRYADEMDKQDSRDADAMEKRHSNEREELNRETFDQLGFLWRKRETELLSGERNMKKLLHAPSPGHHR
jgi:hypothetical protein